jgi:hypothetical protein
VVPRQAFLTCTGDESGSPNVEKHNPGFKLQTSSSLSENIAVLVYSELTLARFYAPLYKKSQLMLTAAF